METYIDEEYNIVIVLDDCPHKLNGILKSFQFKNYKTSYVQPSSCTYEEISGNYSIKRIFKMSEFILEDIIVIINKITMFYKNKEFNTKIFLNDFKKKLKGLDLSSKNDYDGNRKFYLKSIIQQIDNILEGPVNCVFLKSLFEEEKNAF